MTGYGWVALGTADSITDPTCGTGKTLITNAAPCTKHAQLELCHRTLYHGLGSCLGDDESGLHWQLGSLGWPELPSRRGEALLSPSRLSQLRSLGPPPLGCAPWSTERVIRMRRPTATR